MFRLALRSVCCPENEEGHQYWENTGLGATTWWAQERLDAHDCISSNGSDILIRVPGKTGAARTATARHGSLGGGRTIIDIQEDPDQPRP